jgi:hypothetical protein
MTEPGQPFDLSDKKREVSFPGWIIGLIVVLVLGGWYFAAHRSSSSYTGPKISQEEMETARTELDAQKQKVVEVTEQLGAMEQQIANATGGKRKALKEEYNKLSLQQNAEREKWVAMAQQYNEKVGFYQQQGR